MPAEEDDEAFDPDNHEHVVSLANMLHCLLNGDPDRPAVRFALLMWPTGGDQLRRVISNDRLNDRITEMLDQAKTRIKEQPTMSWLGGRA